MTGRPWFKSTAWTEATRDLVREKYATSSVSELVELCGPGFTNNMIIGFAYRERQAAKRAAAPAPTGRPLTDADFSGCRYIVAKHHMTLARGMYCCQPCAEGSSYCQEHHSRTHYNA